MDRSRAGEAGAAAREKPVWLYHHLTVSGPAERLENYARATRGARVTPWRFDANRVEEDVLHRAATVPAAQRELSIAGCHILARQFRTLVEAHQAPDTKLWSSKYLNNLVEQDHRGVKSRIGPMLGFKRFRTAAITIMGIELLQRIRKGQFSLGRLRLRGQRAPAIWGAVLAA